MCPRRLGIRLPSLKLKSKLGNYVASTSGRVSRNASTNKKRPPDANLLDAGRLKQLSSQVQSLTRDVGNLAEKVDWQYNSLESRLGKCKQMLDLLCQRQLTFNPDVARLLEIYKAIPSNTTVSAARTKTLLPGAIRSTPADVTVWKSSLPVSTDSGRGEISLHTPGCVPVPERLLQQFVPTMLMAYHVVPDYSIYIARQAGGASHEGNKALNIMAARCRSMLLERYLRKKPARNLRSRSIVLDSYDRDGIENSTRFNDPSDILIDDSGDMRDLQTTPQEDQ